MATCWVTICALLLINACLVRSTSFYELWEFHPTAEHWEVGGSDKEPCEYGGLGCDVYPETDRMSDKHPKFGHSLCDLSTISCLKSTKTDSGFVLEQGSSDIQTAEYNSVLALSYEYGIVVGNNECVASYKFGENSSYITPKSSPITWEFGQYYHTRSDRIEILVGPADYIPPDWSYVVTGDTLYIKLETIGNGNEVCDWKHVKMEFPDSEEDLHCVADVDECVVMTSLDIGYEGDDVWTKVGCYYSAPYYFSNSSGYDKYLCHETSGWFISSLECGTYQQDKDWKCQGDVRFGSDADFIDEDVFICNGADRWYDDDTGNSNETFTTLVASCANMSMVEEPANGTSLSICLNIKAREKTQKIQSSLQNIEWGNAFFSVVDTLTLNGKPIYYLVGGRGSDYYLYANDESVVYTNDAANYRTGLVYYIYWMDISVDGFGGAWVLIPNKIFQTGDEYYKYETDHADHYKSETESSVWIGKAIGWCFEEDIGDCDVLTWKSDYYQIHVGEDDDGNSTECASFVFPDDKDGVSEIGFWEQNEEVMIALIVALCVLALIIGIVCFMNVSNGKIARKDDTRLSNANEITEPLSDHSDDDDGQNGGDANLGGLGGPEPNDYI